MTEFAPAWFLPGPHLQTVWGRIARPRRAVPFRREVLGTGDGDELVVDHLDAVGGWQLAVGGVVAGATASWAGGGPPPTANRQPPTHFILLHGLEGSSYSVYMQGLLRVIARHGCSATAINFRSCARDPRNVLRMIPNRRPRLYHSGETGDLDFVIRTLHARNPHVPLVAIGASLGGNVLLKWLGEQSGAAAPSPIAAAATLSVPYDLGAGADHLDRTASGRFYVSRFLGTLKKKSMRPDIAPLLDMDAVRRARNFRQFDDAATAPLHGFDGADDYYTRSSSMHYVGRITTPTLALSAEDDPFVPPEVLPAVRRAASSAFEMRTTPCGGHVGFIGGSAPWRCEYWAEELVVRWLLEKVGR